MSSDSKNILLIGGRGALGTAIIHHFKTIGWWIANIDHSKHELAEKNIILDGSLTSMEQQGKYIETELLKVSIDIKFNAIVCVAGGFLEGNALDEDFLKNSDSMWKQNIQPAMVSVYLAAKFLKESGLLVLTGAKAAIDATPTMIGYGMAKAAVHHLTGSVGSDKSGLPKKAKTLALLPITLDTPTNRNSMPKADFGLWTPLNFVATLIHSWLEDVELAPKSGSLIAITTKDGNSSLYIK